MRYTVEMASSGLIYIQSFMKIDAGVQALLSFRYRNSRDCNVGISDGRDL
jgi:hypothetical protein